MVPRRGTHHHVSKVHLHRYLDNFDFAYPRRRRARTRAVTSSAWETGPMLHLPGDDAEGLKRRDERFGSYLDRNAWVHEYDPALAGTNHTSRETP